MDAQEFWLRLIDGLGIDKLIYAITVAVLFWGVSQIARIRVIFDLKRDGKEE